MQRNLGSENITHDLIQVLNQITIFTLKISTSHHKIHQILHNAEKFPPIITKFYEAFQSVVRKGCVKFWSVLMLHSILSNFYHISA
jgi:hypothetical protein